MDLLGSSDGGCACNSRTQQLSDEQQVNVEQRLQAGKVAEHCTQLCVLLCELLLLLPLISRLT
jgi:hypothetical protein